MTKILYFSIICLFFNNSAAPDQISWSIVRSGLDIFRGTFTDHGQNVTFVLMRCDPKRNKVRIVDTLHEIGKKNPFAAFSLREVQKQTRARVVVNAGSTASYSLPAPVGLLQISGKVVSTQSHTAELNGIFCIMQDRISLFTTAKSADACLDAVQRGPILHPMWSLLGSASRHRRTIVAVDADGRLLILVTNEEATLSAIESFLYDQNPGLNVRGALNMDGDNSSGLIVAYENSAKSVKVGNVDGLIASAIAIYEK